MKFFKEHAALRVVLMLLTFVCGIGLTVIGWKMTGELIGLAVMLLGVAMLILTLVLYNKPFETPNTKK